ncbi:MAG: PH domain-containing protein [Bacteroidota bacterium]
MNASFEKTFKSSKNVVLSIIINATIVALSIGSVLHIMEGKYILPLISLITISYLISTFYNIKYIIKNKNLIIVSGFFKSKDYPISNFKNLRKSNTIMAGSASGMRRIEIETDDGKQLIVSPKNQKGFIDSITEINPEIVQD